ncbi:hypothetical protein [Brachybacterium phenoliresistens]|uniref:Uncharacterized protein n=1 Tax=Brachybacterium phenoliresistens TaxID=396014 RepID=Z9JRH9_9MICO|nr:hypothetical protein [Brachybacterium phenoliresistens]EWS80985.1 hypothetical protein BF93_01080 [Brachybacterium phenoliresistens]
MSTGREPLRLVRGALAATLATAVALLGHVLGGGDVPAWAGIALPWWLSITVCTVLAGSRFSVARLAMAVAASQGLFHLLFVVGTPSRGAAALSDAPGVHLHLGASLPVASQPAGSLGAEHLAHAAQLSGPMLLGHLAATAATVAVLHRGESVLLRALELATLVGAILARVLTPLRVPDLHLPARRRPSAPVSHLPRRRRALLRPLLRRGPPQLVGS